MNEQLRIGLETKFWVTPTYLGGLEKATQRLATGLAARGHTISVFTCNNWQERQQPLLSGTYNPYVVQYFPDMEDLVRALSARSSTGEFDLLQIEDIWGLRKPEIFEKVMKIDVPIIWNVQNMGTLSTNFPHPDLFKRFVARIQKFAVVSEPIREEGISAGIPDDKLCVIHNPIDTKVFHPVEPEIKLALRKELGLPVEQKILLYAGRFAPEKGTEFLLESWKQRIDTDIYLVMIGSTFPGKEATFSPYRDMYRDSATFSDGFITDEAVVAKYYQAADMLILPSPQEGFSNAVVEAMACQLPCIVSYVAQKDSGVRDLITKDVNGVVFDNYSAEDLFRAVNRVTPDMGVNGRRKFNELGLDVETITQKYEAVYKDIMLKTKISGGFIW